ncbi:MULTISPECIES: hypothetical protein [Bacillus]|uniref:hypothetical protein n=1 Tax=Bacillus TaxID=1386 RepID=UPI000EFD06A2|nr:MULTISPECIES: hypothetical protein [Bacillus]HEO2443930.1 hypothetical protein [Streptococcus agalactiae]MCT6515524.1 hypothetical protein [Bacillus subtilis]MCV4329358.1 hypothetical protein [Bacillus velezensis]MDQ8094831.1 hypothetical protein [Bacillus amyloliquefaciens]MDU0078197.1 hypothetical protein [Bacillus sp. IG2]
MKKFAGVRSLDDMRTQAIEAGWKFDEKAYHKENSDYVFLYGKTKDDIMVAINTFNGHFFVYNNATDESIATHLSERFDQESWYVEILNIVNKPYVKKERL